MTLNIIGIGLNDEKDITVKGLELVKDSYYIYLENYTSILLNTSIEKLNAFYGNKVRLASRAMVEGDDNVILEKAKNHNVSLLIVGDPFSATTHVDLMLRAKKDDIKVNIINNASVMNAVGVTGLQLYKFGKTTSIVFPEADWLPETPYDVIKKNKANGLHTLCLLDIKVNEPTKEQLKEGKQSDQPPRFMNVNKALKTLQQIEDKRKENIITDDLLVVGCARLGSDNHIIKAGPLKEILEFDFGEPLHCLIVPGDLHFMEEEALKTK